MLKNETQSYKVKSSQDVSLNMTKNKHSMTFTIYDGDEIDF